MTIADIIKKVEEERKITSRYPLRVIFCNSLKGYKELIAQLNNACDLTVNLGDFCAAEDVHPRFRKLEKFIDKEKNKQILLLSVDEYLRLAIRRENVTNENEQFEPFWNKQYSVNSMTRVYLPLFACKEIFARVIGNVSPRQELFVWNLDDPTDRKSYVVSVYSDQFAQSIKNGAIKGFKNWLLKWDKQLEKTTATLITSLYKDCEESFGTYSVNVVENPYEYLCKEYPELSTIAEGRLKQQIWVSLYSELQEVNSVEKVILNAVNLQQFDSNIIATQWEHLSEKAKVYVWIWYQLHTPLEYVGNIIRRMHPDNLDGLAECIANDILPYIENKPDWVQERKSLLLGMRDITPSQQFLSKLDQYKYSPKTIFDVLTGKTMEEKKYIIRTLCHWLRTGGEIAENYSEILSSIKAIYPELLDYLKTDSQLYGEYSDYFIWYKKKKIINRPVDKPLGHPDFENLDTRFSVLSKYNKYDSQVLWIDGMGIEWLSLANSVLEKLQSNTFEIETYITSARVPTETEYNHQWAESDVKRDRLDKLSHKGMPDDKDYFSCIANQIAIIKELMNEAVALLDNHEYILITGDHGSSRLAALAFHEKAYTFAPKDAKVLAYGRFCQLGGKPRNEDILENVESVIYDEKYYLVMKDYNHYSKPGNAAGGNTDENAVAGELHGGLTPEESIVPVIILHKKTSFKEIKVQVPSSIKAKGGDGKIYLSFDCPITTLEVGTSVGNCFCRETEDPDKWEVVFNKLSGSETKIDIIANGKLIVEGTSLKIMTPLGIGKGLLP